MARRANHECLILKEEPDGVYSDTGKPRSKFTTYCGKTSAIKWRMTNSPVATTCPKCSAKFFAQRSGGVTLERLTLPTAEEDGRPYGFGRWGWKSVYKIVRDGECFGLLAIETGWGQTWAIYALEAPVTVGMIRDGAEPKAVKSDKPADRLNYSRGLDGEKQTPGTPLYEGSAILTREPFKSRAGSFRSKEAALAEVPDMIADGFLSSESTVLAQAREELAAEQERRRKAREDHTALIQRDQEAARKASKELDLIGIAFAELTTEGKITNFQREAIILAARHLRIQGLE